MSETTQQPEEQQAQEPVVLTLNLNVEQIQKVIFALNELKTGSDVWPLRQFIIQQANTQLQTLQPAEETPTESSAE